MTTNALLPALSTSASLSIRDDGRRRRGASVGPHGRSNSSTTFSTQWRRRHDATSFVQAIRLSMDTLRPPRTSNVSQNITRLNSTELRFGADPWSRWDGRPAYPAKAVVRDG